MSKLSHYVRAATMSALVGDVRILPQYSLLNHRKPIRRSHQLRLRRTKRKPATTPPTSRA